MKRRLWPLAMVTLAGTLPGQVLSDALPMEDERIQALAEGDDARRLAASDALMRLGAPAVPALVRLLEQDGETAGRMARRTLLAISRRAAGSAQEDAVVEALAAALRDTSLPASIRGHVCRYLAFVGRNDKSIEALAAALEDEEVRPEAIRALGRIPTRAAALALIEPLSNVDPETQVLLLGALRTNEKTSEIADAVETFGDLAGSDDDRVRSMAVVLLGRMTYPDTLRVLGVLVDEDAPGALRATLALAGRFLEADMPQEAVQALDVVTAREALTVSMQCDVLRLRGRLDTEEARQAIFTALHSENERIHTAALDACVTLPGPRATGALGLMMAEAKDKALKIDLLNVLGQRGDTMVDTAAALIKAAATHEDDDVKIAAIQAIESAQLVTPAVSTLILLLGREEGPVRAQAEHALVHLKSEAVGIWITRALPEAPPATKAALLRVLGRRSDAGAIPAVIDAAGSEHAVVRAAAYEAIGQLRAEEGFDLLRDAFGSETGDALEAAEQAMMQIADQKITAKLLEAYPGSDASRKPSLLRVLGRQDHPEVAGLLSGEVDNTDPAIRAAALANIWRHDIADSFDVLVTAADHGPQQVTKSAVVSLLQLARRTEKNNKAEALNMYAVGLDHAADDEQRLEFLEGLLRTLDPRRDDLLAVITPLMDRKAVQAPAAQAAARIAIALPETRKVEAIAVLRRVLRVQPDAKTTLQSVQRLRRLGEEVDPAREAGFITAWWLIGPYPNPGNAMWDAAYMPEKKVDLEAGEEVAGESLSWKKHRTTHPQGVVNLREAVADMSEVGAYAYAEIEVSREQVVAFRMGSDDSIVLWVNGEKVHAHRVRRGLEIDQDVARARLKEGWNSILVKILQGTHAWEFTVRVVDLADEPVPFEQK